MLDNRLSKGYLKAVWEFPGAQLEAGLVAGMGQGVQLLTDDGVHCAGVLGQGLGTAADTGWSEAPSTL